MRSSSGLGFIFLLGLIFLAKNATAADKEWLWGFFLEEERSTYSFFEKGETEWDCQMMNYSGIGFSFSRETEEFLQSKYFSWDITFNLITGWARQQTIKRSNNFILSG